MIAVAFLVVALCLILSAALRAPQFVTTLVFGVFTVVAYQLFSHLGDKTTLDLLGAGVGALTVATVLVSASQPRRNPAPS